MTEIVEILEGWFSKLGHLFKKNRCDGASDMARKFVDIGATIDKFLTENPLPGVDSVKLNLKINGVDMEVEFDLNDDNNYIVALILATALFANAEG